MAQACHHSYWRPPHVKGQLGLQAFYSMPAKLVDPDSKQKLKRMQKIQLSNGVLAWNTGDRLEVWLSGRSPA